METVIVNGKETPKSLVRPVADIIQSMDRQHGYDVVISSVDRDVLLDEFKRLTAIATERDGK